MPTQEDELRNEIARRLPTLASASEQTLKAQLGAAEQNAHGQTTENESPENLAQMGELFLRLNMDRFRDLICSAYARKEIDEALTPANVMALATLLLAAMGASLAMPAVVATLAIVVIRLGLNDFCKNYQEA